MAVTIDLPEATLRRIRAEAAQRGVSIDAVIAGLADSHLLSADPVESEGESTVVGPPFRRLAVGGIGSSGGRFGWARDIDDHLDGFGTD